MLESADTPFLEGEHVDKQTFRDVNEKTKKRKEDPATSRCC